MSENENVICNYCESTEEVQVEDFAKADEPSMSKRELRELLKENRKFDRQLKSSPDYFSLEDSRAAENLLNSYFADIDFESTISYGRQNSNLEGVDVLIGEAEQCEAEYLEKKSDFIETNKYELAIAMYRSGRATKRRSLMSFLWKAGIAATVIAILGSGIIGTTGVNILIMVAIFALLIGIFGQFKFGFDVRRSSGKLNEVSEALKTQIEAYSSAYTSQDIEIYTKIDNIYLNSLDPAHREVVMMRRDQERQHRERLAQQEAHNLRMEEEQRRARAAQEETAASTKRLLDIEEEKERRRKSY